MASFCPERIRRRGSLILTILPCFLSSAARADAPRAVDCKACHGPQASQFEISVHHNALRCQDCHGGESFYSLSPEDERRWQAATQPVDELHAGSARFDHGASFRGKPTRSQVPELCGLCHADVERMNPFGLRTDQLSSYWISGHGKRLRRFADERVAVCTDCHGVHDALASSHAQSRTFFRNIPATCGNCHADRGLMAQYNLPATIPEQYARSVHGRNVLEKGDAGSPNCATCHGSHAAAPPGYIEVGHVCGKCHQQIEEYFLASVHGRVPVMARCIGCHAPGGQRWNHAIEKASPTAEQLVDAYAKARAVAADDASPALRAAFAERVDAKLGSTQIGTVCTHCHTPDRTGPHASFFTGSDERARQLGQELATAVQEARFEYARTAERVARLARGVLLVRNEALRAEDAKTELLSLQAFVHTLSEPEVRTRLQNTKTICDEVNASLDRREAGLTWRQVALAPVWGFILVLGLLMFAKYAALKQKYVASAHGCGGLHDRAALWGRRRFLNALLVPLGALSLMAVVWPALAYVLPARKRGGAGERASAGKEEGWGPWEGRKVMLHGKPVAVIRTESGFKAYSAICTHLGCIVHWSQPTKHFECPCHAAKFDSAGQVVSGPPPKALPEYGVAVVQGEVIIKDA